MAKFSPISTLPALYEYIPRRKVGMPSERLPAAPCAPWHHHSAGIASEGLGGFGCMLYSPETASRG